MRTAAVRCQHMENSRQRKKELLFIQKSNANLFSTVAHTKYVMTTIYTSVSTTIRT